MPSRAILVAVALALVVCVSPVFAARPDLGQNSNFNGWLPYGPTNAWNKDISASPVDPLSDSIIANTAPTVGLHPDFGAGGGIPYMIVSGNQRKVKVTPPGAGESEIGLFPIPPNAAIEGGGNGGSGDSHCLILDRDTYVLYETFATNRVNGGTSFSCSSAAMFNVAGSNTLRPSHWTSSDAAGLPILPGLVRYEDLYIQKQLKHAVRFTVQTSRRAFVPPGTHYASSNTAVNLFPMGARARLKASFVIPAGAAAGLKVWMNGLKTYGMLMADNGSNWFISGTSDARFNDSELHNINVVHGSDFEVIQMTGLVTN